MSAVEPRPGKGIPAEALQHPVPSGAPHAHRHGDSLVNEILNSRAAEQITPLPRLVGDWNRKPPRSPRGAHAALARLGRQPKQPRPIHVIEASTPRFSTGDSSHPLSLGDTVERNGSSHSSLRVTIECHVFDGANLAGSDLTATDLTGVSLRAAALQSASLINAWLDGSDLSNANLTAANLHQASLVQATLVGTTLREANLCGAQLDGADLSNADLTNANLEGASLRACNLTNATLTGAKLDDADLRYARGIWFDQTEVRRTRFTVQVGWVGRLAAGTWLRMQQGRTATGHAPHMPGPFSSKETDDPWSALRRNYTGPAFARTILALILFLFPNVLRAAGLVFFSEAETQFASAVTTATRTLAAVVDPQDAAVGVGLDGHALWIADVLQGIEQSPRYDVWQVLLGLHKADWQSVVMAILFGVLLFYNLVLRYPLTVAVSGLREAEERSGITPARSEYEHLYHLHRVACVLWWVALASGIINLGQWLLSDVIFVW